MEVYEKKIVFVCSPLSGDVQKNIVNAGKFCRWVMLNDKQSVAFAPHVFFTQFLDDSVDEERRLGMEGGLELLKAADEVYVFKTYGEVTNGMKEELEMAEYFGKRITYIDNNTIEEILK